MIGRTITDFARTWALAVAVVIAAFFLIAVEPLHAPAHAQAPVPDNAQGNFSDADLWRAIRKGIRGNVSIPDKQAGQLVQSEGDNWRAIRNGPISVVGGWALLGIIIILALFFLLRGRIKVEKGTAGRTIERFNSFERFSHWLLATSFIVLGVTGLNTLYGRYVLKPLLGDEAFSSLTLLGKWVHDYVAWAFMLGLILILVLWFAKNLPSRHDFTWLLEGGGMFGDGLHPPAKKFNAGQKILFWLVILGGASVSLSGIALLFPFQTALFAKTFAIMNVVGFSLPTELSALQEMQLAQTWHAIMALILMIVIVAHIYIGTIGMEGAFSAMGSGQVDLNWAREHHSIWATEVAGAAKGSTTKFEASPAPVRAASVGASSRPEGLSAARGGKADDLKKISGVGPKLERTLNQLGFFHFDQIADWSAGEIEWVDEHLKFKGRIERDKWISQARKLAKAATSV